MREGAVLLSLDWFVENLATLELYAFERNAQIAGVLRLRSASPLSAQDDSVV